MKVRPAGSMQTLDESMQRGADVSDWDQLMAYLCREYDFWNPTNDNVTVKPYIYDSRTGWNTHLICIDGKAALFSDGPMERAPDRATNEVNAGE